MHRYIYKFYDITQKPQVNKLTTLFKQVIEKKNEEDLELLDGNLKTGFPYSVNLSILFLSFLKM